MASGPDSYQSDTDFRITKDPNPVSDPPTRFNFKDLYDFAQQVIQSFIFLGFGTYDQSLWPLLAKDPGQLIQTGKLNKSYINAAGSFAAGSFVSIINSGGVLEVVRAEANSGSFPADGWTTGPATAGNPVEVIVNNGINRNLTGLAIGQRYWLSETVQGGIQTTKATTAGHIEQYLGIALSATELLVDIAYPIQH